MTRRATTIFAALCCIAGIAGCSSQTSGTDQAAPTVPFAATTTKAPDGPVSDPGPFDPCRDISDATLVKMGYRTDYRSPGHQGGTQKDGKDYEFVWCGYKSGTYRLGVMSGTRSLEDQRQNSPADSPVSSITINGRDGYITESSSVHGECTLAFRTGFGVVILDRIDTEGSGDACAGLERTAETVASVLPKGA